MGKACERAFDATLAALPFVGAALTFLAGATSIALAVTLGCLFPLTGLTVVAVVLVALAARQQRVRDLAKVVAVPTALALVVAVALFALMALVVLVACNPLTSAGVLLVVVACLGGRWITDRRESIRSGVAAANLAFSDRLYATVGRVVRLGRVTVLSAALLLTAVDYPAGRRRTTASAIATALPITLPVAALIARADIRRAAVMADLARLADMLQSDLRGGRRASIVITPVEDRIAI